MTSTTPRASSSLPPPSAIASPTEEPASSSAKQLVVTDNNGDTQQQTHQRHQRSAGGAGNAHHRQQQHRPGNGNTHRSQQQSNNNTDRGATTATSKAHNAAPENKEPHSNFCYKELDHVKYERFPACVSETNDATKILRVAPPNETHPFQEIPAEYCLKTKAFTGGKRITSHCAHYYYNRICNRGAGCFFIHAISFEVSHAQQAEQERLDQHKKILSQQQQQQQYHRHHHASPLQVEDANIYYNAEEGYARRSWGRTRNFYNDQGEIDPDAPNTNSTAPTAALPIFSAPPPKTNTVKVVPDEEDRVSNSGSSNHSSSSTSTPSTTAANTTTGSSIASSRAQSGFFAAFSRNGNENVTSPPSTPEHGPRSSGPAADDLQQGVIPLPSFMHRTPIHPQHNHRHGHRYQGNGRHGYHGYRYQQQQPPSLPASASQSPNQLSNNYYNRNNNGNIHNNSATNSPANKKLTPSRRCFFHDPYSWTETTKLIRVAS